MSMLARGFALVVLISLFPAWFYVDTQQVGLIISEGAWSPPVHLAVLGQLTLAVSAIVAMCVVMGAHGPRTLLAGTVGWVCGIMFYASATNEAGVAGSMASGFQMFLAGWVLTLLAVGGPLVMRSVRGGPSHAPTSPGEVGSSTVRLPLAARGTALVLACSLFTPWFNSYYGELSPRLALHDPMLAVLGASTVVAGLIAASRVLAGASMSARATCWNMAFTASALIFGVSFWLCVTRAPMASVLGGHLLFLAAGCATVYFHVRAWQSQRVDADRLASAAIVRSAR